MIKVAELIASLSLLDPNALVVVETISEGCGECDDIDIVIELGAAKMRDDGVAVLPGCVEEYKDDPMHRGKDEG